MTITEHETTEIRGELCAGFEDILTPAALRFVAALDGAFAARRAELLAARRVRRDRIAGGELPDFLAETAHVRRDTGWRVTAYAPGLEDRRVEITGPPTRAMTVNALNSGASVWMADFEDATSPTWHNIVGGQLNLRDALERRIDFTTAEGKRYRLGERLPTIMVRPRGWHLVEKHVLVNGRPVSASLVDFGLYFFHCAQRQIDRGSGPYFYLPKLEHHLEARLWNDVFVLAQELLGIPRGTIRATVLVETIHAAFQMDEMLYELREHSAGLNAGRWDYVFSVIKTFRERPEFVLPDRSQVSMTTPFMRAYTELLVQTCHRRSAHAIGGMAAFVPSRQDPAAAAQALQKVREDKQRESRDGFDGSWVAHPALVPICREVFDEALGERPHQVSRTRHDVSVSARDLLSVDRTPGSATLAGLRSNVRVSLAYLDAWLRGSGAVAIDNLMEDAATVEISRSQVWQWVHHGTWLAEGGVVSRELVAAIVEDEARALAAGAGPEHRLDDARAVFTEVALAAELPSFFTTSAYVTYLRGTGC